MLPGLWFWGKVIPGYQLADESTWELPYMKNTFNFDRLAIFLFFEVFVAQPEHPIFYLKVQGSEVVPQLKELC